MTSSSDEKDEAGQQPRWGFTRHGLPVHARTVDHHKGGFNKRVAIALTGQVGRMDTFWYFNILSLLSLPATLVLVGVFAAPKSGPLHFFLTFGWIYLITWICQNYIQLVLLPALMVGQNLQNEASDARSAKSFEDIEAVRADLITALDRLDLATRGGLADVMGEVKSGRDDVRMMITTLSALLRAAPGTLPVPDTAPFSSPAGSSGTAGKPAATKKGAEP